MDKDNRYSRMTTCCQTLSHRCPILFYKDQMASRSNGSEIENNTNLIAIFVPGVEIDISYSCEGVL